MDKLFQIKEFSKINELLGNFVFYTKNYILSLFYMIGKNIFLFLNLSPLTKNPLKISKSKMLNR